MNSILTIDGLLSLLGVLAGVAIGGPLSNWIYDLWKNFRSKIGKFPDIRGTWCITVETGSSTYMEKLIVDHQRDATFRGNFLSATDDPRIPTVSQVVSGRFHETDTASFVSEIEGSDQIELTVGLLILSKDRNHGYGQSVYYGVTTDAKGIHEPQVAKLRLEKNGNVDGKGKFRDCADDECRACAAYTGNTKDQSK